MTTNQALVVIFTLSTAMIMTQKFLFQVNLAIADLGMATLNCIPRSSLRQLKPWPLSIISLTLFAHSLFTLGLPHCFRWIVLFFTSLYFVIAWPWTDVKSLCTFMTRKTFTILNLAPFGCISSMSIPKFNCSQGMISKKAEFEVISDY